MLLETIYEDQINILYTGAHKIFQNTYVLWTEFIVSVLMHLAYTHCSEIKKYFGRVQKHIVNIIAYKAFKTCRETSQKNSDALVITTHNG